jgi:hypothetical protein
MDHDESFMELVKLCLFKSLCKNSGNFIINICRYYFDISFKNHFSYIVIMEFYIYMLDPYWKNLIFCQLVIMVMSLPS